MRGSDRRTGSRPIPASALSSTRGAVKTLARGAHTTSTILPMCALVSRRRCASAALASGKVKSITTLTLPAASSGHTLLLQRAGEARLHLARARPQRRAGQRDALHHQARDVDLDVGAAERGDLHDAAVLGGGDDVALGVVAADHVERDVDALAAGGLLDGRDEVLASCS